MKKLYNQLLERLGQILEKTEKKSIINYLEEEITHLRAENKKLNEQVLLLAGKLVEYQMPQQLYQGSVQSFNEETGEATELTNVEQMVKDNLYKQLMGERIEA